MSNSDGTSQETGSDGLTESQAAERFAQMLSDDGDGAGETQEDDASSEPDDEAEGDEPEAEAAEESDEDAEQSDDGDQPPQRFTIKVDGEEQTVTLDELSKGYSRQADYTRKTMALAEERKTLDAIKATAAQDRDSYVQGLKRLEAFFAAAEDDSQELAQLRHANPAEYAARIAEKSQRQQSLQQLQTEQQRIAAESAREEAQRLAQYAKAEEEKLLQALPEWSDPEKRSAEQKRLVDYALNSLGLSPAEVSEIYDHRLVMALNKAAKWDALQAKKPAVQAKVEAVKTARPGSSATQKQSQVTDLTRSKQRLAKTGREADAAAVFLKMLG